MPHFDRFLIALLLFAVQGTDLKAGDIQIFEAVTLLFLPYMLLRFRGQLSGRSLSLFMPIMVFFLLAAMVVYFLVDFHPPPGVGPLKSPLVISLVRLIQFFLIFAAFNYGWLALSRYGAAHWAARKYVDFSCIIAAATAASFLLAGPTGILTPLVYDTASYMAVDGIGFGMVRARGLFVEGGPYGLSLIASLGLAFLLRLQGNGPAWWKIILLGSAVIMSQSKAALLCVILILALYALGSLSWRKVVAFSVAGLLLAGSVVYAKRSLIEGFAGYYRTIQKISGESMTIKGNDGDVAYGRIAAVFIAPRMAADNVLLGVGLGNYSLVRNNPKYLGAFPAVLGWDLPGLGIITLLLEGGIFGTLVLLGSYLAMYLAYRKRFPGSGWIFLIPLAIQACGVQFYFAYHWIYLMLAALCLEQGGWGSSGNPPEPQTSNAPAPFPGGS